MMMRAWTLPGRVAGEAQLACIIFTGECQLYVHARAGLVQALESLALLLGHLLLAERLDEVLLLASVQLRLLLCVEGCGAGSQRVRARR